MRPTVSRVATKRGAAGFGKRCQRLRTCRCPSPRWCAEVAGNAARLVEEGNPNLRGDAVTATVLAGASVRAAATLVEINVSAGGAGDDRLSRVDQLLAATAAALVVVEGTETRSRG